MSFLKKLIVLDDEIFNYSDWSSSDDDEENEVNHRISSGNEKENKVEISFIALKDPFYFQSGMKSNHWIMLNKTDLNQAHIHSYWIKHT